MVDTNVMVSAIFFGGKPRKLLQKWSNNEFQIICTKEIFNEYIHTIEKLSSKYRKDVVNEIVPFLAENLIFIENVYNEKYSRDQDDDKFINCARSGEISYLISGDKDLLVLEKVKDVEIFSVSNFLKKMYNES